MEGTFTFLFTDLEGSTRLWEEEPEAMAVALARHDAILRDAVKASDGRVFSTMGDGIAAVFPTPQAAISAALDAQLTLAVEAWDVTGPLRVRMGVHTGPAQQAGDDYFGQTLNRCARLMGIGHGGQVLASGSTVELLRGALPPEAGLDDKGEHRLRDLSRTEHVFQLTHPGLAREFPPLRTLDAFPGNLRQQLTSFLGREREVAAIGDALRAARLVSLVGAGGVGKTRLALHVAAEVLPRFPDGAWLCELAPLDEPQAVAHALAKILAVPETGSRGIDEILVDALRHRDLLLVLDNCEHLLESVADLVDAILHSCPRIRILATSREALAVDGEHIWPLRPLELESAAIQLFADRAQALRPDFALTESNVAPVAEICSRLDGVPLAIELAAARTASLTPADIARRLDDRFRLLTGGRRTAMERQRTLRGAVEWSYEMLGETERRLFDRLSVFAGGADLEAIAAVCSDGDADPVAMLDLVDGLVSKSLVVAEETDGAMRYSMLETLRQYGEERLRESGEAETWHDRHAAHYASLAIAAGEGLSGRDERHWAARLDREFENLRAAHVWSVSTGNTPQALTLVAPLYPYAHYYLRPEVCAWANTAVELPDAGDHPLAPNAYAIASVGARFRGDFVAARHLSERSVEAEQRLGLPPGFLPRRELAVMFLFSAGVDDALDQIEAWVDTTRARGDPADLVHALSVHALALNIVNARDRGLRLAEEALSLARALGNPTALALGLYVRGELLMESDPEQALELLEEAVEVGLPFIVGVASVSLTSLRGRVAGADALAGYRELIARWRRTGTWPQQWVTVRNLLELLARLGSHEAAAVLYGAVEAAAPAPEQGPERERLVRALSSAEAALGAQGIATAMERGRSMGKDEVIDYALGEVDALIDGKS